MDSGWKLLPSHVLAEAALWGATPKKQTRCGEPPVAPAARCNHTILQSQAILQAAHLSLQSAWFSDLVILPLISVKALHWALCTEPWKMLQNTLNPRHTSLSFADRIKTDALIYTSVIFLWQKMYPGIFSCSDLRGFHVCVTHTS